MLKPLFALSLLVATLTGCASTPYDSGHFPYEYDEAYIYDYDHQMYPPPPPGGKPPPHGEKPPGHQPPPHGERPPGTKPPPGVKPPTGHFPPPGGGGGMHPPKMPR